MRLGRFGRSEASARLIVDLCKELQALPAAQAREAFAGLSPATRDAIKALDYEWVLRARTEQLPPPAPWRWWVMAGGRGGGKTRPACETVLQWAWDNPGSRIALIGKDAGGVRRIQIQGKSGIERRSPPWFKPKWYKSEKRLVWPNDTIAETHSAEEPNTLRGPEYNFAWITELFHWGIPKGDKEPVAWREGIKLSLRLGENPQGIVDSSPRGTEFCITFLLGPKGARGQRPVTEEQVASGEWRISHTLQDHEGIERTYVVVVRRWSSERNAANIAPGLIAEWRQDLKGSRLDAQELDGIILLKVEGALWTLERIDAGRVEGVPCRMTKVVVAVDPTRSDAPRDEAGIILAGRGENDRCYVMGDFSVKGTPSEWFGKAVEAYFRYGADALVYEKNRMGETVRLLAREHKGVKLVEVTATEGKRTRAEPVADLYDKEKVSHAGIFPELEDEMTSWAPGNPRSPNRMDAMVWAVTSLMLAELKQPIRLL